VKRRVLIVDDHPMMREGVSRLIERQTDLAVAGEAGSPAEALRFLGREEVDVVLADITMPGRAGMDFIKDVLAAYPNVLILVLSMHDEAIYAERVLRAGARGYIMKEAGGEKLMEAIRLVLNGQIFVSEKISGALLGSFCGHSQRDSKSPFGNLTDRELEVFEQIGRGKTAAQIATELGMSPKTVNVHRANVKAKLGIKDMPTLIQHAVRWVELEGSEKRIES
jgi:DNA-binding NarL/FixJ family response regulator